MPRHRDRRLERLTQPEAAGLLAASGTAVLAAGSVEQHGAHLPLGTDAYAALTVAERVAARLDTAVVPLGPIGVAPYHLPWAGSLSLAPGTLIALVVDVCASLRGAGAAAHALFRRPDVYPVLRDFHEVAPPAGFAKRWDTAVRSVPSRCGRRRRSRRWPTTWWRGRARSGPPWASRRGRWPPGGPAAPQASGGVAPRPAGRVAPRPPGEAGP